jgi:hypothetical protein
MVSALSDHILLLEHRIKHLDEKIMARTAKSVPCSYERAERSALMAVLRELQEHRRMSGGTWPGKSEIARLGGLP